MLRLVLLAAGVSLILSLNARQAYCQARTGETSGLFGSRSIGSGTSSLGSGSRLGGGGGRGASGSAGTQGASDAGTLSGNERFVRGNRQAGSFVGGDQGDVGRFVGGTPSTGAGGGRGGSGLDQGPRGAGARAAGGGRGQQGQGGQGREPDRRVRVQRRVAFEYPAPAPRQLGTKLTGRIAGMSRIRSTGPLTVSVEGRTAVLRGMVASDHDRVLAEQVALLEPGISRVRNELTILADEPSPAILPPSNR